VLHIAGYIKVSQYIYTICSVGVAKKGGVMIGRFAKVALVCCWSAAFLPAQAVYANDFGDVVIESIEIVTGTKVSGKTREVIVSEVSRALEDHPANTKNWVPALRSMAILSKTAERASTRIFLDDLHRQLLENIVMGSENSVAVSLLQKANPLVDLPHVQLGVGVSERDLGWAGYLIALNEQLPDDPREMDIEESNYQQSVVDFIAQYKEKDSMNRQLLVRIDAWTTGLVAAWPRLNDDERFIASALTIRDELPSKEILQKVTGVDDILLWISGLEIGLTEIEKKAHPELISLLGSGLMSGGAMEFVMTLRKRTGATGTTQLSTIIGMQNLNYDYLFNGWSGGGDAGSVFMGLE